MSYVAGQRQTDVLSCSVSALGAEIKADIVADEHLGFFKIHIPDDADDDSLNKHEQTKKWCSYMLQFLKVFFCTVTPIYLTSLMFGVWIYVVIQGANGTYGPALDLASVAVAISLAFFIVWLFLRFLLVHLIHEYCFKESVLVGAALDLLDPHLMNLFWSLSVRVFWMFQFAPITELSADSAGEEVVATTAYYIVMLGRSKGILTPQTYNVIIGCLVMQIVWTMRSLVLNTVMFKFMLEFMMNLNDTVVKYLSAYALLRRLNSNWMRMAAKARVGLVECCAAVDEPILRAMGIIDEGPRDNRPSLSVKPPALHRLASNILADGSELKNARRFKVDYDEHDLPNVLTKAFVERSKKEPLMNLLGVNYIKHYPTVLFVGGSRVELQSKASARKHSDKLFVELLQFCRALSLQTHESRPKLPQVLLAPANNFQHVSILNNSPIGVLESVFQHSEYNSKAGPMVVAEENELEREKEDVKRTPQTSDVSPVDAVENLTRGQTVANVAAVITAVTNQEVVDANKCLGPETRQCMTRDTLAFFLPPDEVDQFVRIANPGGYDKVSDQGFFRVVHLAYSTRKQLTRILDSQEGIQNVFRRMVNLFVTFIFFLIFLMSIGINVNTVVASGAAVFSSIVVCLSNLYSSFMQSVTLICFLGPYNIGDRIRLNGGDIIIVKKVTTFFTIFEDLNSKPVSYAHSQIINMPIMNESRSKAAGIELNINVLDTTSATKLQVLRRLIERFCYSRPLEWKPGTFSFFFTMLQPGSYLRVAIWATHVESWHNWRIVYSSRSSLYLHTLKMCDTLGISYKSPVSRWENQTKPSQPPTWSLKNNNY